MKNIKEIRLLKKNIMIKCTKEQLYQLLYNEYKNKNIAYNNATFYIDNSNDFSFSFRIKDQQGTKHFCAIDRIIDDILEYINEKERAIIHIAHVLYVSEIYIKNHIKDSLKRLWLKALMEKEYYGDL